LKAIEEGLPIIRAANSGISAIIDPYGRVLKSLPLGAEGVLDGFLPRPTQATFYSEYRFKIPLLLWIVVCTLSMIGLRKKNQ
jgi:apolipoprotein N-acyltransferase